MSSPAVFSGIRVTLSIVVCPFVLFLLAIVLFVLLRYIRYILTSLWYLQTLLIYKVQDCFLQQYYLLLTQLYM